MTFIELRKYKIRALQNINYSDQISPKFLTFPSPQS